MSNNGNDISENDNNNRNCDHIVIIRAYFVDKKKQPRTFKFTALMLTPAQEQGPRLPDQSERRSAADAPISAEESGGRTNQRTRQEAKRVNGSSWTTV